MAASTFKGTAILLTVSKFGLSTPLITIPQPLFPSSSKRPSQSHVSLSILWGCFSCRYRNFFVPLRQCRPSGLLLYYVLLFSVRRVSRSCRFSRSVWLLLSSTMGVKFFWICPVISLFFVPWANSPLIHLHATMLSLHSCTVGLPSRVCSVVSSGPKSLGAFFFLLFLHFLSCSSMFSGMKLYL